MIVQHNIMAINSHRQLGINNTNLSKNLEKLSSGYRINKAADDAAGLAISEKMRAQITALDRAVLNAQDGASLIQTAEGALQEVHGMLNRMVELATQSANGTIQADDRQKIESELTALKDEIDRISQATNFNGIKLLDGSLSAGGATAPGSTTPTVKIEGLEHLTGYVQPTAANQSTAVDYDGTDDFVEGDKISLGVVLDSGETVQMEFTFTDATHFTDAAGNTHTLTAKTGSGLVDALVTAINADDRLEGFTASNSSGDLKITNDETGSAGTHVATTFAVVTADAAAVTFTADTAVAGTDPYENLTQANLQAVADAGNTFKINGKEFKIIAQDDTDGLAQAAKDGINALVVDAIAGLGAAEVASIAGQINAVTGLGVEPDADTNTTLNFKALPATPATPGAGGLTMQVGESDEDYQKITVSVDDMSSSGLGIKNISMATQEASSAALKKINAAIEKVSVNRGNLGALQNRLEHTINNLNVTSENMTAAESRIRDVDMAKEMMQFTKNNVLSQAAQAMLAQSNMQPQNVLQLLR